MGYRSTIYIKINKADKKLFEKAMDEATVLEPGFRGYFDEDEDNGKNDYLRYTASYLKWYSSYSSVSIINNFINDDSGEHLRAMIAIGEDDATESFGSPYELDMYTTTDLEW